MTHNENSTEKWFRNIILARSGIERLMMGCAMFDDAKRMVLAGLRQRNPRLDQVDEITQVFLKLFGNDIHPEKRKKIMSWLKSANPTNGDRKSRQRR